MFKRVFFVISVLFGAVILFLILSVLPIDRYDYKTKAFYKSMITKLDSQKLTPVPVPKRDFLIGYAKVNITPSHPLKLAGYGDRREAHYTVVHDSIFVRTIVITNGTERIALVSADLLLIPPTVTYRLERELPAIGFTLNNTYLGATHSHNSIGHWGKSVIGFMYGRYEDSIVQFITDKIKQSILLASKNSIPSSIRTTHIPLRQPLRNRINEHGGLDSLLHVIEIQRSDNSRLIVMSYAAHATCLNTSNPELSRDYPGKLVDELEHKGYDFAMFLAGAVGSQACHAPEGEWACIDWMANAITTKFEEERKTLKPIDDSTLVMLRVPLVLGQAQVKISKDWKVRPWLFNAAFGKSPNYLTALRIGELVMLGTPCDFSGELTPQLYSYANKKNIQLMITSFNGGYIGYITPVRYYDVDHYETRLMNWYGPGSGEYMQECLTKMIDAIKK